jgi:hypothetical protein
LRHAIRNTQYRPRLALLAALLLAAALRWMQPAVVEFKYDEAHIAGQALDLARGGALPLLSGGTTLGIQRGPLDVYLLALPLKLLGGHVEGAVWLLASLGVLAVALTYALGCRVGGTRVGVLAAWLMAANPWLVFYDRKLWAHIQAVFSVALLLLAWRVIVQARPRAAFWFPVVAALQLLAHVLGLLQGLSWLAALVVAPRQWYTVRRSLGWGLAVGIVLLAPYAWALRQHGGSLALGGAGRAAGSDVGSALADAARLLTGDGLHVLAALPRATHTSWQITGELLLPLALFLGLGLLRLILRLRDRTAGTGARLLLAWTVAPTLLLLFGPLRPPLQYWTVLLPLPALLVALGIEWLASALARLLAARHAPGRFELSAWAGVLLPALLLAGVWTASSTDLVAEVQRGAGATTFGPPLARWNTVVAAARGWAGRLGTQEVRVAVNGVDPGYDGEPAAVAALIGNPPFARFVAPASPPALLLAHDRPSLYLWTVDSPETERQLGRFGAVVWTGELAAGRPPPRLYRLPPATAAALGIQPLAPAPVFDVGLMLLGYKLPEAARAGVPFQVTVVWRVLDPPAAVRVRDMTAFNHILDARGASAAQADGLALLSRDWWPGDVLIQPYELTLPAGVYRWRTGIYSRVDGGRAQLVAGGDSVDLPAFTVR